MPEMSTAIGKQQQGQAVLKKEKRTEKQIGKVLEPYLYILPALLIFGLFVYVPFVKTIYMSFQLTNFAGKAVAFAGIENYKELFTSREFYNSLAVTFTYVAFTVVPSILGGLALALLANKKVRGIRALRLVYAMPMAVSTSCASVIWMFLYHPSIGMINSLLGTHISWLSDTKYALFAVAIVTAWMHLGLNFILILSGLQGIPPEYYESAAVDGARYMQSLFRITLPLITPTLFFVVVINVIESFQSFGQVNIMTGGGPAHATNVLVYTIYQQAFLNNRFGLASASSIILFFMMLIITLIQFRYEKKWVFYR